LASAFGLGAIARRATAEEAPAPAPARPTTLTLYGRRRPTPPRSPQGALTGGGRISSYGDLLDGPEGSPVGEFYANGLGLEAAFGSAVPAVSGVEFQTFQLPDGALFGVGAAGSTAGERTWAILGGTGRFAAARGTYVEREVSATPAGRAGVEFILTLAA
jgi:hypothetical protein